MENGKEEYMDTNSWERYKKLKKNNKLDTKDIEIDPNKLDMSNHEHIAKIGLYLAQHGTEIVITKVSNKNYLHYKAKYIKKEYQNFVKWYLKERINDEKHDIFNIGIIPKGKYIVLDWDSQYDKDDGDSDSGDSGDEETIRAKKKKAHKSTEDEIDGSVVFNAFKNSNLLGSYIFQNNNKNQGCHMMYKYTDKLKIKGKEIYVDGKLKKIKLDVLYKGNLCILAPSSINDKKYQYRGLYNSEKGTYNKNILPITDNLPEMPDQLIEVLNNLSKYEIKHNQVVKLADSKKKCKNEYNEILGGSNNIKPTKHNTNNCQKERRDNHKDNKEDNNDNEMGNDVKKDITIEDPNEKKDGWIKITTSDIRRLVNMLDYDTRGSSYSEWIKTLFAIRRWSKYRNLDDDKLKEIARKWSEQDKEKDDENKFEEQWNRSLDGYEIDSNKDQIQPYSLTTWAEQDNADEYKKFLEKYRERVNGEFEKYSHDIINEMIDLAASKLTSFRTYFNDEIEKITKIKNYLQCPIKNNDKVFTCPYCSSDHTHDKGKYKLLIINLIEIKQIRLRCPKTEKKFDAIQYSDKLTELM